MVNSLRKAGGAVLHGVLRPPLVRKLLRALFPADYTIRPADPARDLDSLARFGNTLRPSARRATREAFRRELAELEAGQRVLLVAAGERGKVLGFVRAVCQGPEGEREWWIAGLEARPVYWRRGIGEALTRALLERLRGDGVGRVRLSVNKTNRPAVALYHKLGFETERPPAGRVEGDDSLRMTLDLTGHNPTAE